MSNLVFVYGTLKRGHGNHRVMIPSGGEYLGDHVTKPVYNMFTNSSYPAITKGGTTPITGEVYLVEDMTPLDRLEGYPNFYNREEIDTPYGKAWVYFIPDDRYMNDASGWDAVPSGKWR